MTKSLFKGLWSLAALPLTGIILNSCASKPPMVISSGPEPVSLDLVSLDPAVGTVTGSSSSLDQPISLAVGSMPLGVPGSDILRATLANPQALRLTVPPPGAVVRIQGIRGSCQLEVDRPSSGTILPSTSGISIGTDFLSISGASSISASGSTTQISFGRGSLIRTGVEPGTLALELSSRAVCVVRISTRLL